MSPAMRVICLLVFAIGVARAEIEGLLVACGILIAVSFFIGADPWAGLGMLLRRIRWLLISMLAIYGWLTPGTEMIEALGSMSPTINGLHDGLLRMLALVSMVTAVHLLLKVTNREKLLSALYQLSAPLKWWNFPRERLLARMVLVLELVPKVQVMADVKMAAKSDTGSLWQRFAYATSGMFDDVLQAAEKQPIGPITFPSSIFIPWHQWCYPIVLISIFWLL